MDKIHSPDNVSNICKVVSHMIELKCPQKEVEKYVRILQLSCHGSPMDHFSMYYGNILSPCEILEAFFKVKNFQDILKNDYQWSMMIVHSLLKLPLLSDGSRNILGILVPNLITTHSLSETEEVVDTINKHRDFARMPVSIIEVLLEKETKYLEWVLLDMIDEARKDNEQIEPWETTKYSHWMLWGSQSSVIFLIIITLLNELLIILKCKSSILHLVESYTKRVSELCLKHQKDFIGLYPLKYQSLIILLKFEIEKWTPEEALLCKNLISKKLINLRSEDPFVVLSLLSQFPYWASRIEWNLDI